MKYVLVLLYCLVSIPVLALDAYFNHAVFLSPEDGTYVENHMLFSASALKLNPVEQGFQARVELTYIFERDGVVIDFSKKIVRSPILKDTVHALVDFLDLQRFFLAPGSYNLSIKLKDLNNPLDSAAFEQEVLVDQPGEGAWFSDMIFIDTVYENSGSQSVYTRGSVEMIPRISGFLGPEHQRLSIYAELYNAEFSLGGQEDFLVVIDVLDARDNEALGSYRSTRRIKASEVHPLLHSWNAANLATGNYLIRIEARDRNNQLMASQTARLQRYSLVPASDQLDSNALAETFVGEISGEDSLRTMLYCLRYKATTFEAKYIEDNWKQGDTTELRRFFYTFWRERNAIDPESAWKQYHNEIKYAEREFNLGSKRKHACSTDRGRVYLHYGKPNTRVIQNREPNASPYEIWHYYALPNKSNAKFVFYDRTLVTNDYVLLHSNVPGEMVDYAWYQRLSTASVAPSSTDEPMNSRGEVSDPRNLNNLQLDEVGSRALDFWNNPR